MSSKIHADYDKVVTKKDLTKVFLREITYEHTWNYERMGNVGFCFSMYPVLKKLYPDKKDLSAAMKRHLTLYQTSHYLATFQMGITAAMEEENAQDADFDTDSIGAVKTALMGPIAGIGDSLFWGTIKVIATGIGCSLALQGNILGPNLFLLIFNIPAYLCRWFGVFLGYKMGRESMAKIVESGLMKVVMEVASIMGIMVVGGMTMDMTSINFITQIGSGEEASTIQDLLNGIVPGLPVLLLFGVTYWLLKKKVNPLLIMLIMLVLGIAGAFFGFLG
uniref:PTS system mannose/fructose/sorbose family transporter subunit IID n=1 Tax=Coprococcus sp. TaxID=2049024 RepID=UPI00402A5DD8